MADRDIEKWKPCGMISLWHYEGFPKNYCGYHFTADQDGCGSIIGLIQRFRQARYPARKRIRLNIPTPEILAIPNCPRKCIPADSLELRFNRDHSPDRWSITRDNRAITIEMGSKGLSELHRGVEDIAVGAGDWATGPKEEDSLWFWWHPNTPAQNKPRHSTPDPREPKSLS